MLVKIWNYVLTSSNGGFLSINIYLFWLPMALDNQQAAVLAAPNNDKVLKLHLIKGFQCHSNQSQYFWGTWKQVFNRNYLTIWSRVSSLTFFMLQYQKKVGSSLKCRPFKRKKTAPAWAEFIYHPYIHITYTRFSIVHPNSIWLAQ